MAGVSLVDQDVLQTPLTGCSQWADSITSLPVANHNGGFWQIAGHESGTSGAGTKHPGGDVSTLDSDRHPEHHDMNYPRDLGSICESRWCRQPRDQTKPPGIALPAPPGAAIASQTVTVPPLAP